MQASTLARLGRVLAAAWLGGMLAIGGLAAPALFSLLARADAGNVAARLFTMEANSGLAFGAVLAMLTVRLADRRHEAGQGSRFSAELMLVLAAIATLIVGHFVVQPMMATVRAGGTAALSFGALHGVSTGLYAVRVILVAILAWRLSA